MNMILSFSFQFWSNVSWLLYVPATCKVYARDRPAYTMWCRTSLRQISQIKLAVWSSHCVKWLWGRQPQQQDWGRHPQQPDWGRHPLQPDFEEASSNTDLMPSIWKGRHILQLGLKTPTFQSHIWGGHFNRWAIKDNALITNYNTIHNSSGLICTLK